MCGSVSNKTHCSSQKEAVCFQALDIKAKEVKYLIAELLAYKCPRVLGVHPGELEINI